MLSKGRKPDKFESSNPLKLSFTNIRGLRSSFVECESFLEPNSTNIFALCEVNLDDSIHSGNFSVRGGYLLLIRKDSVTHICIRLALLYSVPYFFFLYRSPSSSLSTVFAAISSNINEVLSINRSTNVFVFGDFNVYH